MKRRTAAYFFVLLSLVNLLVFFFRDHFRYRPLSSYAQLYQSCDESCTEKWKQILKDVSTEDIHEAKGIADSIFAGSKGTTYERAGRLAQFLQQRFYRQLGKPVPELLSASPLQQYKILSADTGRQLWCGNLAQMFSLFCWSRNITCRYVEIMKPGDHHVINEVYLPEYGNWAVVDLTNNLLFFRDRKEQLLGLADIRNLLNQREPVRVEQAGRTGAVAAVPIPEHYRGRYPTYYFHRVHPEKFYTPLNRIRQYFLPVSWYDIFDDTGQNNILFYLKDVLFLLWLVAGFVFMRTGTKFNA